MGHSVALRLRVPPCRHPSQGLPAATHEQGGARGDHLSGERARYLRKQLGLTQQELAERADIDRVTVAKWETGDKSISPQHDFLLRGFALAELMRAKSAPREFVSGIVAEVLDRVRTASAPESDEPLHIGHAA